MRRCIRRCVLCLLRWLCIPLSKRKHIFSSQFLTPKWRQKRDMILLTKQFYKESNPWPNQWNEGGFWWRCAPYYHTPSFQDRTSLINSNRVCWSTKSSAVTYDMIWWLHVQLELSNRAPAGTCQYTLLCEVVSVDNADRPPQTILAPSSTVDLI